VVSHWKRLKISIAYGKNPEIIRVIYILIHNFPFPEGNLVLFGVFTNAREL
jgi:hypothetical protein